MKYVLDSGVAVKWVLPEADSARALRLRDEFNKAIHELIAPDIFLSEIANALATAERQRRIKPGESALLLQDLVRNSPVLHPAAPLLLRAMEVSIATKRAVYDCVYLALAEAEGCELVTINLHAVFGLRSRLS